MHKGMLALVDLDLDLHNKVYVPLSLPPPSKGKPGLTSSQEGKNPATPQGLRAAVNQRGSCRHLNLINADYKRRKDISIARFSLTAGILAGEELFRWATAKGSFVFVLAYCSG